MSDDAKVDSMEEPEEVTELNEEELEGVAGGITFPGMTTTTGRVGPLGVYKTPSIGGTPYETVDLTSAEPEEPAKIKGPTTKPA